LDLDSDFASAAMPFDDEQLKNSLSEAARDQDCDLLIIVGIGGSNMGCLAVASALQGLRAVPRVLFADTIDARQTQDIIAEMRAVSAKGKKVVLNAISKSGTTIETAALLRLLLSAHQEHEGWQARTVFTTGKDSDLWRCGEEIGVRLLSIPEKVGGRFSVFSAVGTYPLAVLGVDTQKLLSGAKKAFEDEGLLAAQAHAAFLKHHLEGGRNVHDLFLFSPRLEGVGRWYRQLLAESIGKEHDKQGNLVRTGLTPTTSIGSTDLHSVAQLAIGGPDDKCTTFVDVQHHPQVRVPQEVLSSLAPLLAGQSLDAVMGSILNGTLETYRQRKRPFVRFSLENLTEEDLGELLQTLMVSTMLLGEALGINAFDQPAVEEYKRHAKEHLLGGGKAL
jgi:glucose-6-phosphate isomerase